MLTSYALHKIWPLMRLTHAKVLVKTMVICSTGTPKIEMVDKEQCLKRT